MYWLGTIFESVLGVGLVFVAFPEATAAAATTTVEKSRLFRIV